MGGLSPMHLAIVLIIALLVFGPQKLPEIGRGLGQAIREFKRASRDFMSNVHEAAEEPPRPLPPVDAYAPPPGTQPVEPHQLASGAIPPSGPSEAAAPAAGAVHVAAAPDHLGGSEAGAVVPAGAAAAGESGIGTAPAERSPETPTAPERSA